MIIGKKNHPPYWLDWLLERFCAPHLWEEVQGDLHERYQLRLKQKGINKAYWFYFTDVVSYLRPAFYKRKHATQLLYTDMFQHNLLLAYRTFKRFKGSFFINLIGLSLGIACTLLIYLWISNELHIDTFHEKDHRLFQIMENRKTARGIETGASGLFAEILVRDMPQVEYGVTVTPPNFFPKFTLRTENQNVKAVGKYVGKDFLSVFSYDLVQGQQDKVLIQPDAIVLSESTALRLFNTTNNLIGKTIEWQVVNLKKPCVITGIIKDVPSGSSEQFDFLLPFEAFQNIMGMGKEITWNTNSPFHNYVVVKENTNLDQFQHTLDHLLKTRNSTAKDISLFLKLYSKNYLYGTYENGVQAGGRIVYVQLFSLIALFILLIAGINFMNLATARASRRIKEIGIKKAIGASRFILILQYLSESLLMAFCSLLLALLMVVLLLPQFNQLTGKQIHLDWDLQMILSFAGITFFTGLIAGSYPAFYLSGFKPTTILKGIVPTSWSEIWTRTGLVVFQFTLSVVFIVSVIVIYKQIEFVQHNNLGYDKDHIIYFETEGKIANQSEVFLTRLKNIPGVLNASSLSGYIINSYQSSGGNTTELVWNGENIRYNSLGINYDLIETLGITIKEGRSFSNAFPSDSAKIIVNETFVKRLGLINPVGQIVDGREILGVTKDFHFQSPHEKIPPTIFRLERQYNSTIVANIQAGKEKAVLEQLAIFYKNYNPGFVFDYRFLNQDYQTLYVAEQRVAILSRYFAGLAIIISCLGLFGLATFTAERRRKEIGIRKVLGSSEWGIIYLLSREFTRIVLLSITLALPVSYVIASDWLKGFAYRISLHPWYFITAGLVALGTAWVTVGIQAVKAAHINPSQCLKDE
ncbi:permease prefix domain 2-containing transporter [Cytophagaceae bacterium YF14B1]|uniref:Permease prefix domain 2-containing transporter n=1 Tax=Xanthocytophaga flava TaxID=3048013 RepID=A0AAE3QKN1_9BACT|nr:ABC transporter permease [Xanthocytophaga flavus]MDJ1479240.1 permease prefix domain 2-containing transporter [Xanthocytophaga flavus]